MKRQFTMLLWVLSQNHILRCSNQSYYTGYTDNLEKRFQDHLTGKGGKYTRSFKPLSIAQSWKIKGDKSIAMRIEYYIKKLSKSLKRTTNTQSLV